MHRGNRFMSMSDAYRKPTLMLLALLVLMAGSAAAQPEGEMSAEQAAMMEAWMKAGTPGEPHKMLAKGKGTWAMTLKSWMDPSGEPMLSEGTTEREVILDGRVVRETIDSSFMGMPFHGVSMTGYDNVTERYWSTWVDNMSTGIILAWGELDEESGKIVFEAKYSDPMTGGMKESEMHGSGIGTDKETWEFWEEQGGQKMKTMEMVLEKK